MKGQPNRDSNPVPPVNGVTMLPTELMRLAGVTKCIKLFEISYTVSRCRTETKYVVQDYCIRSASFIFDMGPKAEKVCAPLHPLKYNGSRGA